MHDLMTLLTWSSKVSVESSVTPRIFSTPLTVTLLPATVTLAGRVTRWSRCLVPKNATLDFVGFSSRPFAQYQSDTDTYHNRRSRMLHKQRYFTFNICNFFSIRIVNMWNTLPAETTDFSGLDKFNEKSARRDANTARWP